MKAGAVNYLSKPLDETELLDAIGEALQKDRRQRVEEAERYALESAMAP